MSFKYYLLDMKTMTIALLKANFSNVVKNVRNGETIAIEYGKSHEKLGVIIPYKKYLNKKRNLGLLKGKASYKITSGFKITDNELLGL